MAAQVELEPASYFSADSLAAEPTKHPSYEEGL